MRKTPYLQRRGDGFAARIAVPHDLRAILGVRELTAALPHDKQSATVHALRFGANAKQLFGIARRAMTDKAPAVLEALRKAREQTRRLDVEDKHLDEIIQLKQEHARDVEWARLAGANEALQRAVGAVQTISAPTAPSPQDEPSASPRASRVLLLSDVIVEFIDRLSPKQASMNQKHKTTLALLSDLIGKKRINELKQSDLNEAFDVIQGLPPQWKTVQRRTKKAIRDIARENIAAGGKPLAKASFERTHRTTASTFLKWATGRYVDQGFPSHLKVDHLKYEGDREADERKQRPMQRVELERLFEGSELAAFARSKSDIQRFWFLVLSLHSGARLNELCQINPQHDIHRDDHGNVYLSLTTKTPGDERLEKKIKNKGSVRTLPLHPKLIELGFVGYLDAVKASGAQLLFPLYAPDKKRAGPEWGVWFGQLLRDLNLRDETPEARLVGHHSFRATLLRAARSAGVDATMVTGHLEGRSRVVAGYEGKDPLEDQIKALAQITFDLEFPLPVEVEATDIVVTVRRTRKACGTVSRKSTGR